MKAILLIIGIVCVYDIITSILIALVNVQRAKAIPKLRNKE